MVGSGTFHSNGLGPVTKNDSLSTDLSKAQTLTLSFGGHTFQLTKLSSASCSHDSTIGDETGHHRSLNTLSGAGTGLYDGRQHYSITFTLQDSANGKDPTVFVIKNASGTVVAAGHGNLVSGSQEETDGP